MALSELSNTVTFPGISLLQPRLKNQRQLSPAFSHGAALPGGWRMDQDYLLVGLAQGEPIKSGTP